MITSLSTKLLLIASARGRIGELPVHAFDLPRRDRDDEPTARYCLHCETRIEECSCRR